MASLCLRPLRSRERYGAVLYLSSNMFPTRNTAFIALS